MSHRSQPVPSAATLSVEELADYFRISRTGVYRLFTRGDLKPLKIGSRTVVRRIDADAFLAARVGAA
ncbi:helix-turn-helix domain-containing protein [Methylobacterium sp. NMS14P]|uniref:helix-turn-helix domain-containing protein n=1 Tax=Methylobacterium sp. NMS14P TaxID=2894310 RepID=UPI00235A1BAE|nr:helix-turn-helix domain-containing protein [Methylobacterium sp. NMS14P]WCS26735.1 helix-turn-helix domain-containing protein [Methylobacterium sp. NMS14P]